MKVFLMTSPVDFAGEHELIEQLFESYPFSLQIRKPEYSESQMEKFLLGLPSEIREMSIVHGFKDLATSFSMAGYAEKTSFFQGNSLDSSLKNYAFCRKIEDLLSLPKELSGAFLYPIYDSLTEPSVKASISAEYCVSDLPFPVFACGGVSEENFSELLKRGFAGAVVCGSVWNYADPLVAFKRITRMAFRLS